MTALLLALVALLTVANVLNNRLLPRAYVATCLVTATVLLALARAAGTTWVELGLGPVDAAAVGWAVLLVVLTVAGYAVVAALPRARVLLRDERATRLSARGMVFETLVSIPMGTVVLEETAFRSVLPAVVAADHGVATATAVASALFGLWHVLPSAALVRDNALGRRVLGGSRGALARAAAFGVLFTAAAGAFLCWLRFETGSVVVPAALHWATNAVGVVAAWLLARRARDDGDLAD